MFIGTKLFSSVLLAVRVAFVSSTISVVMFIGADSVVKFWARLRQHWVIRSTERTRTKMWIFWKLWPSRCSIAYLEAWLLESSLINSVEKWVKKYLYPLRSSSSPPSRLRPPTDFLLLVLYLMYKRHCTHDIQRRGRRRGKDSFKLT